MEVLVQTDNLTKQYGQHKVVNNMNLSMVLIHKARLKFEK